MGEGGKWNPGQGQVLLTASRVMTRGMRNAPGRGALKSGVANRSARRVGSPQMSRISCRNSSTSSKLRYTDAKRT